MKTVVSYAYYETSRSAYNLDFFAQVGIIPDDSILFVIVINGGKCCVELPRQSNCVVLTRPNVGYDFGAHSETIKYLKSTYGEELSPFDNFIFMNCGVIGPFLPTYYPKNLPWTHVFTSKLNSTVKLVGTIMTTFAQGYVHGAGPHIEGFCFCLDKIGLNAVIEAGTVFKNHESKTNTIIDGEWGVSNAILQKGYTIDSLLYKYQSIDWSDPNSWISLPHSHFVSRHNKYDGISVHPFETVFHKWYWENDSMVSMEYVSLYRKWKLNSINKNKKIHVSYGIPNYDINVTNKFIENFVRGNWIRIPENCVWDKYFSDVASTIKNSGKTLPPFLKINGTEYTLQTNASREILISPDRINIFYGTDLIKINVTQKFLSHFQINKKIIIPSTANFNDYFGDPCWMSLKKIFLNMGETEYVISEVRCSDIDIDIDIED